ncbi:pyruvate dehydrogenase (acetyl-transferring), homodimeric type [Desulfofustis glycolicus]|uniref:Pyruvate dehydrogenase E1 component n=1 Tax=Desulfofustis glycolicus DSM 9705 TaxID=1121409 RepID=A0A1M5VVA9_9BACT|nr:pyruvate dehydrogenase (acetyl-transferring), homodimeric type [Desulfofustis glycolicus]MCB2216667.1 pyruvate dehydrogenase (acetyl-transferring), homodimeric type [Desulfobulbaceae bacterium]SHH79120.1 pyruvate dehydrogenase E1 component [Desulfofustis glycolicus DSM 9705]
MSSYYNDPDPQETNDWLASLDGVIEHEGKEKADFLLRSLTDRARSRGVDTSPGIVTPYGNTITPEQEVSIPGDDSLIARNVAAYVRWNAMAMVARANKDGKSLGGHIATFSSVSAIYEVGFNWFFRGPQAENGADLVYFQGHSSPGIYARAFVEGRLSEEQLDHFRREVDGRGLSSYPHPWLMPDFWEFPTVSMGLGPMLAIYQARFMRYLDRRGLKTAGDRKVWFFMGDGESDEPEALGALPVAAREQLDNLIFVVNCNLQRLDGPVRGNGKIIQELEGRFRGAGWNVIKVIWGSEWDKILARDREGRLLAKFGEMVDGDFQTIRARGPAYLREKVFGDDPHLQALVEDISDNELWQMTRGGHDPRKIYAAFSAAVRHRGQPTVILVKTIKGFGMGQSGESVMVAHNVKKMDQQSLQSFRDRFHVPLEDDRLTELPFIRPADDSPEARFLQKQRDALGGPVPLRRTEYEKLTTPSLNAFSGLLESSKQREISTTMAFVRMLSTLVKDKEIGKRIVPIIPDEARTFGMEGLFRQLGIYAPTGQLYEPQDSETIAWYREDPTGQILEEGITEAGSISSWTAAGTAHVNYNLAMIPFYIFYSIFGFQRIGDQLWAAGDARTRGFLLGATSGRTTLNGEGLQHQDGHALLFASTYPSCRAYDPTFGYEVAVLIQKGIERMYRDGEDVFYYITLLNENYPHPEMPEGVEEGIERGIYLFQKAPSGKAAVQLMGSGSILREVIAAAELLREDFSIDSTIWSVLGINQLHRDGLLVENWNRLHPDQSQKRSHLEEALADHQGPAIIATDYVTAYAEQIRRLIPNPLTILGTDGYGRSDTRERLRRFFRVDRYHIVIAALAALARQGEVDEATVQQTITRYSIDPETDHPITR